jgi:hypothetical protein
MKYDGVLILRTDKAFRGRVMSISERLSINRAAVVRMAVSKLAEEVKENKEYAENVEK